MLSVEQAIEQGAEKSSDEILIEYNAEPWISMMYQINSNLFETYGETRRVINTKLQILPCNIL